MLADRQNRTAGTLNDLIGDGPVREMLLSTSCTCSHHDEVGAILDRRLENFGDRCACAHLYARLDVVLVQNPGNSQQPCAPVVVQAFTVRRREGLLEDVDQVHRCVER